MVREKINISLTAAFTATILTAALFVFLFFYIGIINRRYTYEDSKAIARQISSNSASEVEIYLSSALMTARSIEQSALIHRKYHGSRSEIQKLLYSTLSRNSNYMTAWTMWEPNAYDNQDEYFKNDKLYDENGSFALTYYRYKDSIYFERNVPTDYNDDYYVVPRQVKKEMIVDPFYYKYDDTGFLVYETSAAVPVFADSVFLGVFGIDINMHDLQNDLNRIRIYDTGFLTLLTGSGKIVSHIDSSMVNKNFFSTLEEGDSVKYAPFTLGKELSIETTSQISGAKVFRFFYPINVGSGTKPWSLMVEIPIDKATIRSKQLFNFAIGTLILGMALIIYLIINIYDRKLFEKNLIATMQKVEEGNRIISESERKFREMSEMLPQTVFEADLNGTITYVNKTGLDTYGLTEEDIQKGINILSTVSEYDRKEALENVKITLRNDSVQSRYYTALRKGGTPFPVQIYSKRIMRDQQPQGIRGIVIDITERIKAEEQIRKNEARLQKSQAIGHFGYSEQNLNSSSVWASAEAMKIFGFEPTDGYVTVGDIISCIDDIPTFQKKYHALVKEGTRFDLEFAINPADGSPKRHVHAISELEKDESGNPAKVVSTFQDITERIKVQENLLKNEAKLNGITQNIPGVVFQFYSRRNGEIGFNYVSEFSQRYLGLDNTNIDDLYERFLEGIPREESDSYMQSVEKSIKEQIPWDYEGKYIKPDGEEIYFKGLAKPRTLGDDLVFDGLFLDITESKLAEAALEEKDLILRNIFLSAPLAIGRTANRIFRECNEAFYDMTGYSPEEIIGKNVKLIYSSEEEYLRIGDLQRLIIESISPVAEETCWITKDGRKLDILLHFVPLDPSDTSKGFTFTAIDITDNKKALEMNRRKAERAQRQRSAIVKLNLEKADASVVLLDRFKTLNEAATEAIDIARASIWLFSEDKKEFRCIDMYDAQKNLHSNGTVLLVKDYPGYFRALEMESRIYAADARNDIRTSEFRENYLIPAGITSMLDAALQVRGIQIGVICLEHIGDIRKWEADEEAFISMLSSLAVEIIINDERNTAEKALKESEHKYRTLMENMNEVVMMVDNNDRIQYVNKRFVELLGYNPEDIIGKEGFMLLSDQKDKEIINNADKKRKIKKDYQYEISFAAKDGNKKYFLVSSAPIYNTDGIMQGTILALVDITRRKKVEDELENYRNHLEVLVNERTEELASTNEELSATNDKLLFQRKELELALENLQTTQKQLLQSEKMASIGILAAGVAHEINNPLNFIQGGILGLESYFSDNLPEHIDNVSTLINAINTGVKRSADIVTSLSHYSRKDDLSLTSCDINFIIDNCLIMLETKLKNKINIQKHYTENRYTFVGSEGKLHQVFLNILLNACQSIEKTGTIIITTKLRERNIIIYIEDNGIGISQDNLNKIFDPFFTTKGPGKGTGLGLSISYKIIQEHKGTIEFNSELGSGTKVKIKLPVNNTDIS